MISSKLDAHSGDTTPANRDPEVMSNRGLQNTLGTSPASLRKYLTVTLLLMGGLMPPFALAAKQLTVYTYHDKPPYFSHKPGAEVRYKQHEHNTPGAGTQHHEKELYGAFIELINYQQDDWHLELVHLPRKRLNLLLKAKRLEGAVIGVNSSWFNDANKQRYLWSSEFMHDMDVVVVSEGNVIPYLHPEDLAGKTLALQRGFYFWGITEQAKAGKIEVLETTSDRQNVKLVTLGRVSATIMSDLTLKFFQDHKQIGNKLVALPEPHDRFTRHLMFTQHSAQAYTQLADTIELISKSPAWRAQLASYR